MKNARSILPILFIIIHSGWLCAQQQQVDAGLYSGLTPDTLIIKARPSYTITGQSVTNSQLTVKWSESSPITALQWLYSPIGLFPQGQVVVFEGYRYQVYGSFGGSAINWAEGQEYTILKLLTNSSTGACTKFEIAQDAWTLENNGDYYFEILGEDKTGILYKPVVNFGSEGGYIDGDTLIYLGNTTGILFAREYNGNIIQWERSINQGTWEVLPGTAGQAQFEDVPTIEGIWSYRVKVEKPGCQPVYSTPGDITVELLAVWTGTVSTSWDDPGNWNVVGIPSLAQDGQIPVTVSGFYPEIDGNALCKNLLIEENAALTILPQGFLTLSGFLQNDGSFTMLSDTLTASSLLDNGIKGNGTCNSEIIFRSWPFHLCSSPINDAPAEAFAEMLGFRWDEQQNQWILITDPDETLEVLTGYLVETLPEGGSVLLFNGSGFTSGPVVTALTNNGNSDGHTGGFNLAGNPYPSAINWNDTANFRLDQVDPVIYILNEESGNYGTYIRSDEGSSTLGIDSIIGVHQGFFVHVNHEYDNGSLSLNNSARFHDHEPLSKKQVDLPPVPYLKILVGESGTQSRDEAVVRFVEGASENFDSQLDAYDLPGFSHSPQLFTMCPDSIRLTVNTYPALEMNTAITMGFQALTEGMYDLTVAEMINFSPDTLVMLEDRFLDTLYHLIPGFSLDFSAMPGDDYDRFRLHFIVDPTGAVPMGNTGNLELTVLPSGVIVLPANPGLKGVLEIFDLEGRLLRKEEISESRNFVDFSFNSGIYIIRVVTRQDVVVKKVFPCAY